MLLDINNLTPNPIHVVFVNGSETVLFQRMVVISSVTAVYTTHESWLWINHSRDLLSSLSLFVLQISFMRDLDSVDVVSISRDARLNKFLPRFRSSLQCGFMIIILSYPLSKIMSIKIWFLTLGYCRGTSIVLSIFLCPSPLFRRSLDFGTAGPDWVGEEHCFRGFRNTKERG